MGWLLLFPIILVGVAAVVSVSFVRLSTLSITRTEVEIRNFPQPIRVIPFNQVERFVPADRVGWAAGLRPTTAVLVLTDGSRLPVRSIRDRSGAQGVDALNARLTVLRTGT